ncbi:MAG: hypothetical protein ABJA18_13520 [bacterium]
MRSLPLKLPVKPYTLVLPVIVALLGLLVTDVLPQMKPPQKQEPHTPVGLPGVVAQPAATTQNSCGTTFAGIWHTQQNSDDHWEISVNGDSAEGTYSPANVPQRLLRGKITDSLFEGEWFEIQGKQSGTFVANLISIEHRVQVAFYSHNVQIDTMAWFCESPGGGPTPPTTTPTPVRIRDDHDTDNFATFDSLTRAEQEAVLTKRGPRLPVRYEAHDLSMRVLVKGGWPLLLEYDLASDKPAVWSIAVADHKPLRKLLEPGKRQQISLVLGDRFGAEFQVAKLRVLAETSDGQPASFQLDGLAIGERGIQALLKVDSEIQLAMYDNAPRLDSAYEPLALFGPAPQSETSLQLIVELPFTLKAKQKPEIKIPFGLTSHADFSNGRWEWWHVSGTHWEKVWQETTGSITRNQAKSKSWNGIITSRKVVFPGHYSLHITAWQGADDRGSLVVQTWPGLLVIE